MDSVLADALALARRHWLLLLCCAIAAVFVFPLCRRSIGLSDEGYLLLQALEVARGTVLYRDMDAFVTPGAWLLLAALFKLVEPSVFASRSLVLIAYVALIAVAYRIVSEAASRWFGLAAVAALMIFTVWAFPAWTFVFYSPFAVLFGLAALERLLAWGRAGRGRDLLWSGLFAGLAGMFKQNYGAYALLGCALGLLVLGRARGESPGALARAGGRLALGTVLASLPVLLYLGLNGALTSAFDLLIVHPFQFAADSRIPYLGLSQLWKADLLSDTYDRLTYLAHVPSWIALPTGWVAERGLVERMHVLLFWIPPIVFASGLLLGVRPRRRDPALLAVVAVCALIFLGVFPRADFNHLINVYQVVIVAAAVLAHRLFHALGVFGRAALLAPLLVLLVAYASASAWWYAAILSSLDTKLDQPRGGVLLAGAEALTIGHQVYAIRRATDDGEAVLTVPDLAMLNFLSDRPMPSRFYNLYRHHIGHDGGAGVVAGAEEHGVRLAIVRHSHFFRDALALREYAPRLVDYLRRSFTPVMMSGNEGTIFLGRRPAPLPPRHRIDVLDHCDVRPAGAAEREVREIREHVLFSSLYHKAKDADSPVRAETRCEVRVPEGAELVLRIGYRRPAAAARGATAKFEILALTGDGSELLLENEMPVEVPRQLALRPHREVRVPLERRAGEVMTLLFRSEAPGGIAMHAPDWMGFALVFEDPHLEAPLEAASGAGH